MSWPELYASIAYCSGWTIPHIREELDLPTLDALRVQWARFPPLPIVVAHYLGAAKPSAGPADQVQSLSEQDAIPAQALPAAEFDALVARMGLVPNTPPSTP